MRARATQKLETLEWAARKMLELARAGDRDGVEGVYRWARARISGSNARKWALADARQRALEILGR